MTSPRTPLFLIVFGALVFALCWFAITSITTPLRAGVGGAALAVLAGIFIWFAKTDRHAFARGVIALGATALAAPIAAVMAATNDMIVELVMAPAYSDRQFAELDAIIQVGWRNAAIGAGVAFVLIFVGGFLHRTPRD